MTPDVVVDVGNTRIKWGLCSSGHVREIIPVPPDSPEEWERSLIKYVKPRGHQHWVVSGVHPARMERFARWLERTGLAASDESWIINSSKQIPVEVCVDFPDKVGLDRLFNAVAVNVRRRPGQPAVCVDAGSAVTVDYVDAEGKFRGGAIFPGLGVMTQSLHAYTAQLPIIEIKRRLRPPETSTDRAIELGVFHAVLGGIELLVRDLHAHANQPLAIFFGGGDAALLAPHLPWPVTVWPEMTLQGIRIAGERLS